MFDRLLHRIRRLVLERRYVVTLHAEAKIMTCDVCGQKGARIKHVSRAYGKGDDMVVIDQVPIVVCPNCGESYMTADTLHEVERLKLHKRNMKTHRLAPVIIYV